MKLQGWLVGAVVAGGSVMAMKGCLSKPDPDVRLGSRFEDMCDIARANVDTPERGVRALGKYLGKHSEDLFGEWGATLATIEKIGDDAKHDARARVARDRLQQPLRACERDWQRFGQAVQDNPEAAELVNDFAIRLNRTLEILLGNKAHFDFVHLPEQLERALDAT